MQFFALPPLRAVCHLSRPEQPVKVLIWFAGAGSVIFRLSAPERLGGVGDLPAKSAEKAEREQVDIAQAAGDVRILIDQFFRDHAEPLLIVRSSLEAKALSSTYRDFRQYTIMRFNHNLYAASLP